MASEVGTLSAESVSVDGSGPSMGHCVVLARSESLRSIVLCGASALIILAGAEEARASHLFLQRVASGFDRPVFVTAPGGDGERLFIVEQWVTPPTPAVGRIKILDLATLALEPAPFLEIPNVSTRNEGGLLGLAFHPGYATNGLFYVYYQVGDGNGRDTVVEQYQVSADPDLADAGSAVTILEIPQPQTNHNGGWLAFGADGHLYIATGDGGGANDNGVGHTPGIGNSQDTSTMLGKILRIDVDGDDFPSDPNRNYAIPSDNPFVGASGADEIYHYGLRNPYRCGFDRNTGDLYIGDVGQAVREEIDVHPAASPAGVNYGWRLREGTIATPTGGVGGAKPPGAIDPVYEYTHGIGENQGFAVIGGYVYRGPAAALQGRYFFSDNVTSRIWSFVWDGSSPATFDGTNFVDFTDWTGTPQFTPDAGSLTSISSFGEDDAGNLYIVSLDGDVFRLTEHVRVPGLSMSGWALLVSVLAAVGFAAARRPARGTA